SGPGRFNEDGFVAVVDAADGSPVGAPAVTVAAGAYPADLVRLGDGFAAFWMDQTNFGRTLRARRVSPAGVAGAPVEIHRPLNSTQPGDRAFVSDAAGQRAVALWVEQDDSGLRTRYRLQARVVDAQLQPLTDVLVLSDTTAQFRPYTPAATWQGDQVVVAWLGGFELFARTIGRGGVLAPPEPVQLADLLGAGRGKVRLVSTPAGARGLLTSEGNWRLFGVGDDASLTLPLTRIRPDAGPYLAGLCALPDGLLVAGDGPDGAAWLAGFGFDGQPKGEEPTLAGGPDDPRALVDLVCDRPALVWRPPEGPPALDVAPIVERCGPRCDDPRFAGPDCDRCADPRFAGPECDVCAAGFRGAGCALCVSPELEGELCDQCRDARYVAPDCVQCADEARAGDQCDRQRLLSIDCGQSVSLGRKAPLGTVAKWGSGGHGTEVLQAWDLAVAGSRSNNYCLGRADRFACFGSTALRITANEPAPPVRDADIGDTCACAVRADASLYCWGTDPGGVFQVPPGAFTQVAVGWTHACAVSAAGAVVCWGDDAHGQASPPPLAAVQRVAAGETFTCALHGEGEGQ
ncbi:MAG: hypothetical protein KC613_22075, partial [Myxococcales bacterium]|nr:hypothetical protein [Myxococcales bacterium]